MDYSIRWPKGTILTLIKPMRPDKLTFGKRYVVVKDYDSSLIGYLEFRDDSGKINGWSPTNFRVCPPIVLLPSFL